MTKQSSDFRRPNRDEDIVVLFGTDEHGKPRAARFEGVDPHLIEKAAAAMNLQLFRPQSANHVELAKKLAAGRVHANGTGFVAPVRGALYSELQLVAGIPPLEQRDAKPEAGLPRDWESIEVGHLVIAQEDGGPKEGWWEAIVLAKEGDMLTLKWRDFPKQANAVRHASAVALLKPPTGNA